MEETEEGQMDLDLIVFGSSKGTEPKDYLSEKERRIVLSTIQWIGRNSPPGGKKLQELAIWMTGCGYDFTQHEYFLENRHLLKPRGK